MSRSLKERQALHRQRKAAELAALREYAADAAEAVGSLLEVPEGQQILEAPGIRVVLRGIVQRGRILAGLQ